MKEFPIQFTATDGATIGDRPHPLAIEVVGSDGSGAVLRIVLLVDGKPVLVCPAINVKAGEVALLPIQMAPP